jgi:hypothetical protein
MTRWGDSPAGKSYTKLKSTRTWFQWLATNVHICHCNYCNCTNQHAWTKTSSNEHWIQKLPTAYATRCNRKEGVYITEPICYTFIFYPTCCRPTDVTHHTMNLMWRITQRPELTKPPIPTTTQTWRLKLMWHTPQRTDVTHHPLNLMWRTTQWPKLTDWL